MFFHGLALDASGSISCGVLKDRASGSVDARVWWRKVAVMFLYGLTLDASGSISCGVLKDRASGSVDARTWWWKVAMMLFQAGEDGTDGCID